jgi:chromosome segregation ATPase
LEDQARRLHEELAARNAEHAADAEDLRRANVELATLRGQVDDLQKQLKQAHIDLEQAASLREELDAARNSSKLMGARMKELMERTLEVERLREQIGAAQTEFQQVSGQLNAVRATREETEAARAEAIKEAADLRARLAEVEQARETHVASLDEVRARWEAERQAIHAESELRHQQALAAREQQQNEEQAHAAAQLRDWQERHETAERQLESERTAFQVQIEQVRAEAETVRQHLGQAREGGKEETARLVDEIERLVRASEAATQREHDLADHIHALQTEQRQALATLRTELEAAQAELMAERERTAHAPQSQESSQAETARLEEALAEVWRRHDSVAGDYDRVASEAQALRKQLDAAQQHLTAEMGRHAAALAARDARSAEERQALEAQGAAAHQRFEDERSQLLAEAEAARAERDALAARHAHADTGTAGLAEKLRAAHDEIERQHTELATLGRELEAARAEAAVGQERAAHAAEEQAQLAAGHAEWQEQLAAVRRQHDEERAALRAEADHLREQREDALHRAEAVAAERDAVAAARQQVEERLAAESQETRRQRQEADALREALARRERAAEQTAAEAASLVALEQGHARDDRGQVEQEIEALRNQHEQERAALAAQVKALTSESTDLTRQRDEALAGWDVAARFLHETEERARNEMANVMATLDQSRREQGAQVRQLSEIGQRFRQLDAELQAMRAERDSLAAQRSRGDGDRAALEAEADRNAEETVALRRELEAAREEARSLHEHVARAVEDKALVAAGRTEWEVQLADVRQKHDAERDSLRAEADRLREELTSLRTEHDRLAAQKPEQQRPPSHGEIALRYHELLGQVEDLRIQLEQLQEGIAGQARKGVLGRLFGRSSEAEKVSPDTAGMGRRVDALRVDVAVERERALRSLTELEKTSLERQLADAQARLRALGDHGPQARPGTIEELLPFSSGPGTRSGPRPAAKPGSH